MTTDEALKILADAASARRGPPFSKVPLARAAKCLHDESDRLRQALRAACRDLAEQGVECPYSLFGDCERGYSDGCNEGEDAETEDCLAAMYIRQAPGGAEGEG